MTPARTPGLTSGNDLAPPGGDQDAARIAQWLVARRARGAPLLVLTDYDGTLSPLVDDPGQAWLPAAVRGDLAALARAPRTRLAVVSGRDLADLRARVSVPHAIYAGCHGLEIDGPDAHFQHPDAGAQGEALRAIARELGRRAAAVPGMFVEPKRFGLAVHYRRVAPALVPQVEAELARAIPQDGGRLKIFHGARVIEIQPQVAWTKGDCVLWIRDIVGRASAVPPVVLYMGDDWTDEHAFAALEAHAITVKVGTDGAASRAAYRIADVAGVHRLVAELARAGEGTT